jgi:nucleoside-diphosphate-sugar epimerase
MKKLMIIGGTGFFGKSILDSYARGLLDPWSIDSVVVIARHASILKIYYPQLVTEGVELLDTDITLATELPYADYIIHAAASSDATKYFNNAQLEKDNIILATSNYCNLAKRFHQQSKIVYCSSGAVYGPQPKDLDQISEDYTNNLNSNSNSTKQLYAIAKREAEFFIHNLGQSGHNVSIARCFAFVGPYLPLNQNFAIGNFILNGLNHETIKVNTKQQVYRSYMYSDDLVGWLMTICCNSDNNCPIYNVGSDQAISISSLANKIANYFNVDTLIPKIESKYVDRYIPSTKKVNSLGCEMSYSLDDAIENTVIALKKAKASKHEYY